MKIRRWFIVFAACTLLALLFTSRVGVPAARFAPLAPAGAVEQPPGASGVVPSGPIVVREVARAEAAPLRDTQPKAPAASARLQGESENESLPKQPLAFGAPLSGSSPAAVQTQPGSGAAPTLLTQFNGVGNIDGAVPPDANGDVGPNHYVQWVNLSFAIYTKTGARLYGPAAGNTLFANLGGACASTNDGDPIVLYDSIADRWLMSQFSLGPSGSGPFYQCIAVSKTGDPYTGGWWLYAYAWPGGVMNDYPHFGVWPDGYYLSVNQFNGTTWAGAGAAAFQRSQMLNGGSAQMIYFNLYSANTNFGGMLPADFDGHNLPPSGAPGIFAEWDDGSLFGTADAVRLWNFHVDWTNAANATFGQTGAQAGQPNWTLPTGSVTPFDTTLDPFVPQPGTSQKLDTLGDRIMHRLQYRNFGSYQTLLSNHTVSVNSGTQAGVHWFELRNGGSGWSLYQDGVYAPSTCSASDAKPCWRWMGSLAMNGQGQIALGYSLSSAGSTYPSIAATGRMASDPLGTLGLGETILKTGGGSQTSTSARWGDYSMLAVDPSDDCTFWYTNEYLPSTSNAGWQTSISSFRLASQTLSGLVQDSSTGQALPGALVTASGAAGTISNLANSSGAYSLCISSGTYSITAQLPGYYPKTVPVTIGGTNASKNFVLTPWPYKNYLPIVMR